MKALYHIRPMHPTDRMSGWGFSILLYPAIKDAVIKSGLTQGNIDCWLFNNAGHLLDVHGYKDFSPHRLRIAWCEWGPEHIDVPGNACGLDIGDDLYGGKVLLSHNVDSVIQAHLLLCLFTGIMDYLMMSEEEMTRRRIAESEKNESI